RPAFRRRARPRSAVGPASPSRRSVLGAQDYFERRAEPRPRREPEAALDVLRPRPDVLQALARGGRLTVEAFAVVTDRDEPLIGAHANQDLRPSRIRVLAHVCESLLDDAEDLDLLVGREPDGGIDLEVDLEPAVGRKEVDVPP